jgi:hypothetical protein
MVLIGVVILKVEKAIRLATLELHVYILVEQVAKVVEMKMELTPEKVVMVVESFLLLRFQ